MILSRGLQKLLVNRKTLYLDRGKLPAFKGREGFVPFVVPLNNSQSVHGNLLIDRTLSSPIQVVNWEKTPVSEAYIEKAIKLAWEARYKYSELCDASDSSTAFRLVNSSSDRLPAISIDVYGKYGAIHLYSQFWNIYKGFIAKQLIQNRFSKLIEGVYLIDHTRSTPRHPLPCPTPVHYNARSHCIAGRSASKNVTVVQEHGIKYKIRLDNGPALGLYLDQRQNRYKILNLLRDLPDNPGNAPKSLLNAFCFTGSFSLIVAKTLNAFTTNIDASSFAIHWVKENFMLNEIELANHEFRIDDVFQALVKLNREKRSFNLIVLDPPTVSHVRLRTGQKTVFSTSENYSDLIALAAPLTATNGYLVAFVNTHKLDKERWQSAIQEGLVAARQKVKTELEEEMHTNMRHTMRKRGVKVKYRQRALKRIKFEINSRDMENMFKFEWIDYWTQDARDFPWIEDQLKYLHGIVLKRITPFDVKIKPPKMPNFPVNAYHTSKQSRIKNLQLRERQMQTKNQV
ncbi:putative ribosomal RNA large subunit methyltransferase YwbD [Schistocerca gregaria]|uniref:putative ribosomal RNA large subunit methyltransferase YwbD n=1 Tax=Schistocerca gregaria TaxID=7010 RepID=UPI00211EBE2A|nr:putative ribosomal RNA large subunit methyltransferase YwbD [Schistocerca gregaria]